MKATKIREKSSKTTSSRSALASLRKHMEEKVLEKDANAKEEILMEKKLKRVKREEADRKGILKIRGPEFFRPALEGENATGITLQKLRNLSRCKTLYALRISHGC
eukprot:NODE_155_length_16773_cov_0.488785.p15 type:complete len:106 gc:universal NODE_155_length_16773_cov_0.488785:8086-8403(+)